MYYEEKWIDGDLHCRSTPDGEWVPVSREHYREMLKQAEFKIAQAATRIDTIREVFDALAEHYEDGGTSGYLLYQRLQVHQGEIDKCSVLWLSNILNVARDDDEFNNRLYKECYE